VLGLSNSNGKKSESPDKSPGITWRGYGGTPDVYTPNKGLTKIPAWRGKKSQEKGNSFAPWLKRLLAIKQSKADAFI